MRIRWRIGLVTTSTFGTYSIYGSMHWLVLIELKATSQRRKFTPSSAKSLLDIVSYSLPAQLPAKTTVRCPSQTPAEQQTLTLPTVDTAHNLGPALPKIPFKVPLGRPGFGDSKRHTFARFSEDSQKLLGMKLRHLPEVITDTLQSLVDKQLV